MRRPELSRRAKLLWIGAVILMGSAALSYDIGRVIWWHDFVQPVTDVSWLVSLPGGGSIRYTDCSPRMRYFGPADSEKRLAWLRPDGRAQSYPISNVGGGYREMEVRLREDDQALWLVSLDQKSIIATLDLQTGEFTANGVIYDAQGEQNMYESGGARGGGGKGGRGFAPQGAVVEVPAASTQDR